jgi:hypothetical protein
MLGVAVFWMGWDLVFSGSSQDGVVDGSLLYMQGRSSLTYGAVGGLGEQFDWHRNRSRPFIMRFEDFFVFILQILNVVTL